MSDVSYRSDQTTLVAGGDLSDYVALLKPRVMWLSVFTAGVGMFLAPGSVHPVLAVIAIICIAAGAGAAGALNMWYDADIDAQMQRTAARPIPRGKVSAEEALVLGAVLSVLSVMTLGVIVNPVAGALLGLTIAFYLFIYTMWLKRRTPQNIVIGGAAGAFPPMVGWSVVTGGVAVESVLLFAIIFLWTPPHFWALALYRMRDYERVGVPMLPVVAGTDETRRQILIYSVLFVASAVAPPFAGLGGAAYVAAAAIGGLVFLALAWRVYRRRDGRPADAEAKRLFQFSILYLFLIFAVLLGERVVTRLTA
jgi:protoheme IX farnesyltransferase